MLHIDYIVYLINFKYWYSKIGSKSYFVNYVQRSVCKHNRGPDSQTRTGPEYYDA